MGLTVCLALSSPRTLYIQLKVNVPPVVPGVEGETTVLRPKLSAKLSPAGMSTQL